MARNRYTFDEKKIARFLKEGRGSGHGRDYKPWLTVQDVPSKGRSHRVRGRNSGRQHDLLSDIEFHAFLIYDWSEAVTDIREQFPLDRDDTRRIAATLGLRHPVDRSTGADVVMTTDLVVDLMHDGKATTIARAVKPSSDLEDRRTLEKLEIERRRWIEQGVDFGIVTERDLPRSLIDNLRNLNGFRQQDQTIPTEIIDRVDRELAAQLAVTLRDFCSDMDVRFGLEAGGARQIIWHLLATRRWIVDLNEPIDNATPMSRFARKPDHQSQATA